MIKKIQLMVLGVLGSLFALSELSRRLPRIGGLQPFRQAFALDGAQRDLARRRWDVLTGIKFILMGLALPILYVMSRVMLFNEPTWRGILIAGAGSLLCFVLGGHAIRSVGSIAWSDDMYPEAPKGS